MSNASNDEQFGLLPACCLRYNGEDFRETASIANTTQTHIINGTAGLIIG